jgi:hypothetical protein
MFQVVSSCTLWQLLGRRNVLVQRLAEKGVAEHAVKPVQRQPKGRNKLAKQARREILAGALYSESNDGDNFGYRGQQDVTGDAGTTQVQRLLADRQHHCCVIPVRVNCDKTHIGRPFFGFAYFRRKVYFFDHWSIRIGFEKVVS